MIVSFALMAQRASSSNIDHIRFIILVRPSSLPRNGHSQDIYFPSMCRIVVSILLSEDGGLCALFSSARNLAEFSLNTIPPEYILCLVGSSVCGLIQPWHKIAIADLTKTMSHPHILRTLCQVSVVENYLEPIHAPYYCV